MSIDVDALYEGFCRTLPVPEGQVARALAKRLGLAPIAGVSWNDVFSHAVTLKAPALVAEALPHGEPELVRLAVLGHMLAVLEAFGTDRIEDRQVAADVTLNRLLSAMRRARDAALAGLIGKESAASAGAQADQESRQAIVRERELLTSGEPVSFETYRAVSLGKQSVGFPASLALAARAGWDASKRRLLGETLAGVWLGLQFEDDVLDWEKDWSVGGAWAVTLAHDLRRGEKRDTRPDLLKRYVLGSGVLERMLKASRDQFETAATGALELGCQTLGQWALQRQARLEKLIVHESQSAGYTNRLSQLGPWAAEVLS
jgi:hypothetical protein